MIDGHGPTRGERRPEVPGAGSHSCAASGPGLKRRRPTSLIRDIRDRASGGNQINETSHPSRARPSEPNSTPPTEPAGLLMQPETASAINTGGPLHELGWAEVADEAGGLVVPLGIDEVDRGFQRAGDSVVVLRRHEDEDEPVIRGNGGGPPLRMRLTV